MWETLFLYTFFLNTFLSDLAWEGFQDIMYCFKSRAIYLIIKVNSDLRNTSMTDISEKRIHKYSLDSCFHISENNFIIDIPEQFSFSSVIYNLIDYFSTSQI